MDSGGLKADNEKKLSGKLERAMDPTEGGDLCREPNS